MPAIDEILKGASHLRRDRDEVSRLRLLRLINPMSELPLPRKPREQIKRNPLILHLSRLKREAKLPLAASPHDSSGITSNKRKGTSLWCLTTASLPIQLSVVIKLPFLAMNDLIHAP